MYESGQSPSVAELRHALRRLETALADHERQLAQGGGEEGIARVLRRDLEMMREEAELLRVLVGPSAPAAG